MYHPPADTVNLPAAENDSTPERNVREATDGTADPFYSRLILILGILTAIVGTTGLLGEQSAIVPFGSLFLSYFSIAFSTALIWIFFGAVLVFLSVWPSPGKGRFVIMAGIGIIAIVEALEIPLNVMGARVPGRSASVPGSTEIGQYTAGSSFPVAPFLIIAAAIALLLLVKSGDPSSHRRRTRDALGLTGSAIAITSLLFILGYLYGVPFLYGTPFIPVDRFGSCRVLHGIGFCCGSRSICDPAPVFHRGFCAGPAPADSRTAGLCLFFTR